MASRHLWCHLWGSGAILSMMPSAGPVPHDAFSCKVDSRLRFSSRGLPSGEENTWGCFTQEREGATWLPASKVSPDVFEMSVEILMDRRACGLMQSWGHMSSPPLRKVCGSWQGRASMRQPTLKQGIHYVMNHILLYDDHNGHPNLLSASDVIAVRTTRLDIFLMHLW